jgi:hypothetical protein
MTKYTVNKYNCLAFNHNTSPTQKLVFRLIYFLGDQNLTFICKSFYSILSKSGKNILVSSYIWETFGVKRQLIIFRNNRVTKRNWEIVWRVIGGRNNSRSSGIVIKHSTSCFKKTYFYLGGVEYLSFISYYV